jgi:non-ribosomal peptide synthetase component F
MVEVVTGVMVAPLEQLALGEMGTKFKVLLSILKLSRIMTLTQRAAASQLVSVCVPVTSTPVATIVTQTQTLLTWMI